METLNNYVEVMPHCGQLAEYLDLLDSATASHGQPWPAMVCRCRCPFRVVDIDDYCVTLCYIHHVGLLQILQIQ